jgi:branched-chain amino acid aminotransferase, group I
LKSTEKIWINGEFVKWEDAKVHVLSHALNYGTGVFEGIRVYPNSNGKAIFRLKDHMRRFFDGLRVMDFHLPYTLEEMCEAVKETVRVNEDVDYLKPCAFLAGEAVGLNPVGVPISVSITAVNMGSYLGKEIQENGAKLIISSWKRPWNMSSPAGAKINGLYVTSCLAKMEAVKLGADEALMLNAQGNVAECSGENIFIIKRGKLYTPKTTDSILEGITRNSIIKLARDMGYEALESEVSRLEVYTADEVFMTGTAAEITPVTMIDHRPIGDGRPGSLTRQLQEAFHNVVSGKDRRYADWLEYV